jgi:catechol 2,3-dioxygenase-like lactoylglutathione lyase family enzyme
MLAKADIIAFVTTADGKKARKFYEGVLGLKVVEDTPFAMEIDANGTMLRVAKAQKVVVPPYTVLGWKVVNIGRAVKKLAAKGVRFERYDGMGQDESGIWASPSGAKVAWFKDPDGNTLSVTEFPKPSRGQR